jgi:hypothetical protein
MPIRGPQQWKIHKRNDGKEGKNQCVRKVANSLEKEFSQEEFSLVHFAHCKLKESQKIKWPNHFRLPREAAKKNWEKNCQHFM